MSRNVIRNKRCQAKLSLSHTTYYRHITEGLLPSPFRVSTRASGLLETEIDAILEARVAGRTDDEIRKLVRDLEAARGRVAA